MTQNIVESATGGAGGWTAERLAKIPEYKDQIIEGLRQGLFMSEIVGELEIKTALVRKWRAEDREFDEACADAIEEYMDGTEKEAVRRARYGTLEPVISQGKVVMDPKNPGEPLMQRKYSDSLMMFILKGRRREVYGDQSKVQAEVTLDTTGAKSELARKLGAAVAASTAAGVPGESE